RQRRASGLRGDAALRPRLPLAERTAHRSHRLLSRRRAQGQVAVRRGDLRDPGRRHPRRVRHPATLPRGALLMALGTANRPDTAPGPHEGARPRQSFETWSWFFMRISGLVLLFLALIHFALTHIIHDVATPNYKFVQHR